MNLLAAAGYLALLCAAGLLSARALLPRLPAAGALAVGLAFAAALQCWLPALPAFFLGFRLAAVLLGAALALLIAAASLWRIRRAGTAAPDARAAAGLDRGVWLCVLPALALGCVLLFTHTLSPGADGSLYAGQSTYGDLPMHLAFINSIAANGVFPPRYTLVAGDLPMAYPFLCETPSSALLLLGLPLRAACLLPQFLAMASVFVGAYAFLRELLEHAAKAVLAFWLFFLGSGLGFFWFLGSWDNFTRIFTAFYQTPTNDVTDNIVWVNPIVDLLVPQRATLFGWALLMPCLFLLARLLTRRERAAALPLGLLGGALPLIHTHSFLALAVLSAVLFVTVLARPAERPMARWWLRYGALAAALGLPQIFCFTLGASGAQHFVRLAFNWVNAGRDPYLWFYIKNIGVVYLLAPFAFFHARPDLRRFYVGGLALLALCEFIIFQPNAYDNNKLLFIWHLMGCMLAADLLVDFCAAPHRRLRLTAAALAIWLATFGSVLTVGRELVSRYQQFGAAEVAAADWAKEDTPTEALFLTADNHNNAAASLAGRRILCGSGSYLYFHGLDYSAQYAAEQALLTTPSEDELRRWGVDYVWFSSYERSAHAAAESWYAAHCPVVYQNSGVTIYRVG